MDAYLSVIESFNSIYGNEYFFATLLLSPAILSSQRHIEHGDIRVSDVTQLYLSNHMNSPDNIQKIIFLRRFLRVSTNLLTYRSHTHIIKNLPPNLPSKDLDHSPRIPSRPQNSRCRSRLRPWSRSTHALQQLSKSDRHRSLRPHDYPSPSYNHRIQRLLSPWQS